MYDHGMLNGDLCDFLRRKIVNFGDRYWILVHTCDKVFFTLEEKRKLLSPELEDLSRPLELRAFNESGELHLWKWNDQFYWRLLVDDSGISCPEDGKYATSHVLWGTNCRDNSDGSCTLYEEGRGCQFGFPLSVPKERLPLTLLIYNYYRYDNNGLLGFYDARLVVLLDGKGERL